MIGQELSGVQEAEPLALFLPLVQLFDRFDQLYNGKQSKEHDQDPQGQELPQKHLQY